MYRYKEEIQSRKSHQYQRARSFWNTAQIVLLETCNSLLDDDSFAQQGPLATSAPLQMLSVSVYLPLLLSYMEVVALDRLGPSEIYHHEV